MSLDVDLRLEEQPQDVPSFEEEAIAVGVTAEYFDAWATRIEEKLDRLLSMGVVA